MSKYEKMDITLLEQRYPDGIPTKLNEHLEKFQNLIDNKEVLRVKILSNFGLDLEQSLTKGLNIYKGFVIELSRDYKLNNTDKFWLHPQLMKTRNLYKSTNNETKEKIAKNTFDISSYGSSVAFYTTHSFDEIGGYKEEDFVIIDTSQDDIATCALDHWFNSNSSLKDVYNEMHTLKFDGKVIKDHTDECIQRITEELGGLEKVSSDRYNVFYKSNNSFLFYNHALKSEEGQTSLIHISPLMGYVRIKGRGKEFEADLMSTDNYLDINNFNEEQRKRAYVSCKWSGKNVVNTFTLRKPVENYKSWLGEEKTVSYRMENGYFSNTPNVVEKLQPKLVLFLTPEATLIPEEKEVYSHIKKNIIKLPATEELLTKLVKQHWRQVFSKKFISANENLALPRDLLQELLKE